MPRKNAVEEALSGTPLATETPATAPAALPSQGGHFTHDENGQLVPYVAPIIQE